MRVRTILSIVGAGIILVSCKGKTSEAVNPSVTDTLITVTREQFESAHMVLEEPKRMAFDEIVRCNGYVVARSTGIAVLSTPVSGNIARISCVAGQRVNSGQVLLEMSGNEFIELQKDFSETASQLVRFRSEFERAKLLFEENVATKKEYLQAESEFKTANARYSALKIKIGMLGLEFGKIEAGDFYASFPVRSPINGYISDINVTLGQYVDPQTPIAGIVDISKLQLKLAVFERDLSKLKENQEIVFNLLGDQGKTYMATLKTIGKQVENDSRAVQCYAEISDLMLPGFVNNAYIEALIKTRVDTVLAIPEESVLKSEGSSYILELVRYEKDNFLLKKVKINVGRLNKGYAEILNRQDPVKIVTKGAYDIVIE